MLPEREFNISHPYLKLFLTRAAEEMITQLCVVENKSLGFYLQCNRLTLFYTQGDNF